MTHLDFVRCAPLLTICKIQASCRTMAVSSIQQADGEKATTRKNPRGCVRCQAALAIAPPPAPKLMSSQTLQAETQAKTPRTPQNRSGAAGDLMAATEARETTPPRFNLSPMLANGPRLNYYEVEVPR